MGFVSLTPVTVSNTPLPVVASTPLPVNVVPSWTPLSKLSTWSGRVGTTEGQDAVSFQQGVYDLDVVLTGFTVNVISEALARTDQQPGYARARIVTITAYGPGNTSPQTLVDMYTPESSSTEFPYIPLPNVYLPVGLTLDIVLGSDATGRCVATFAFVGVQTG